MALASGKYHTRSIEMATYDADEKNFIAVGRFTDVQLIPSFRFNGDYREAGVLHDLEIHLLIAKEGLAVEDLEVFIHAVPHRDCLKMEQSLKPVIGVRIERGFLRTVRERVGGVAGCTHLIHLLSTLSQALMQGYWMIRDCDDFSAEEERSLRAESMARFMKDSCYAWREDGESYKQLVELFRR